MSLQYARLIVNPAAGAGKTAGKWLQIKALLKSIGFRFDHDVTEAPGQAIELAKSAAQKGYDPVVAVGGDGTINEVANGLCDARANKDITLGIISTGAGCDYVRGIGAALGYEEACERLTHPRKLTVDLGMAEFAVNGREARRVFVNFAGLGFDAEVTKATTKRFKALGSTPSYLLGLLTTFLTYRNKAVSITIDGKNEGRKVCTAMASKGRYGGGGMLVAPNADPSDGFLDVMVIDDLSKLDLLWSLPRIYKGTHLAHPKVVARKAKEISIRSAQPMSLQIDGELLGQAPARFYVIPAALNLAI